MIFRNTKLVFNTPSLYFLNFNPKNTRLNTSLNQMLRYEEGNFKILLLLCLSEMTYNISVKPLKISVQMFNGNLVTAIFAYQL